MLRPQGYATWMLPDAPVVERDSATCGHCQQIIFVKPGSATTVYLIPQLVGPDKEEPGACCRVCMRAVCLKCHGIGRCLPWEKAIERSEARGRFLRSVGLVVALVGWPLTMTAGAQNVERERPAWWNTTPVERDDQFISKDKLTGTTSTPAADPTVIFSEDFQTLNPSGALCTDCLHFTTKWTTTGQPCRYQGEDFGAGLCPTQPYWGYSLVADAGSAGVGDHVLEVWHARAVDQVNIGYQVDIPDSPSLATAGEVYWGAKYKVITANAFATWDTDDNAGMNKFIDFGAAGTATTSSRVLTTITNNQDNYFYMLGGSCAGISPGVGCTPSAWGISATPNTFNAASINNKYGAIGVSWGVSEEGAGPGLIGVDGLTGIPSGGWVCFEGYAKAGAAGVWEVRLWRAAVGATLSFASPTFRHVGGAGPSFDLTRTLSTTGWNGVWYLGGYVGEPTVDFHYQINDFWIGTGFRANACQ